MDGANRALRAITDGGVDLEARGPPAPLQAEVLPWLLAALFAAQVISSLFLGAHPIEDLGLSAQALREGRWHAVVTHMFVHAGIGHILMNFSFAAVVTVPVTLALGLGLKGALRFSLFFMVCGLFAAAAFLGFHPDGAMPAVGASGALSGLWGGVARLTETPGRLAPPWSRQVWRASWLFLLINVVVMGMLSLVGLLPIAWEAHLGGYLAGLLLFGLFLPRDEAAILSSDDHQPQQGA
jgi:membrane associated rhomboid family serine protease